MDSKIISLFFCRFESPYIGSPYMIGGNQIYSAIMKEHGKNFISSVDKVSHGIFHSIPPGSTRWKGGNLFVSENTAVSGKGLIESYEDFMKLREYNTPFIKDTDYGSDYNRRIIRHQLKLCNGEKKDSFAIQNLSFFIISDKSIEINKEELLCLGSKRNLGFGRLRITDSKIFEIDSLDYSIFKENQKLVETSKTGIIGVRNHKKYGFGEFSIEPWIKENNKNPKNNRNKEENKQTEKEIKCQENKKDKWIIRLTTPMCLSSTLEGAEPHDSQPSFMVGEIYRKHREFIWKNKLETLYCASDGCVFFYVGN